jgi:peptide-methionine (S)-S-oxide reductase
MNFGSSSFNKGVMPTAEQVSAGREATMPIPDRHYVNGNRLQKPFPEGMKKALFGLGCFWGAERIFWQIEGVYSTAVGYAAGMTPNPIYEEVCSGLTAHNEVVLVIYDPAIVDYQELLRVFWQSHNPTQGMRQGNDVGTQYRSGIYPFTDEQKTLAFESLRSYQSALTEQGFAEITTEILDAPAFYYAEPYHQQYLAKNPSGYCGLGGAGVSYPK